MLACLVLWLLCCFGHAQESRLELYTRCPKLSDFQQVQKDRLPNPITRRVDTAKGEAGVNVNDGFRVLMTYSDTQPFINLKAEQLGKETYARDKRILIENLQYVLEHTQGMDGKTPQTRTIGDFQVLGISRAQLEGGVLSIYLLFNDVDRTVVTIYFLNAEPVNRKFATVAEFQKLRDRFLDGYAGCLSVGTKH
jgi:hypothetical protein